MFFGERFGVIRPRASYIRSVCGCISASSAATEIMNTPRRRSIAAASRFGPRPPASARARSSAALPTVDDRADASRSSCSRGSWSLIALAKRVERLALLAGELLRHLDLEPVEDVAAFRRPPGFGGPSPRSRCTVPCWVPAGTRIRFVPCSVGTSTVAPWIASATVIGTLTSRLPSSRWRKTGDGVTLVTT